MISQEHQHAFALLADAVKDYYVANRRAYSAGLKPELKRRDPAFDEQGLGFASFRRFLEAAERAGVVDVHPARRGPDIELVPPGEPLHPEYPVRRPRSPGRLRSDLWKAWVDWTPGYRRLYDRQRHVAERIPAVPVSALSPEHRELVEALDAGDERVIPIAGLSIERQLEWMTEFVAEAGDFGARLSEALRRERPAQEFVFAMRSRPDLAASGPLPNV